MEANNLKIYYNALEIYNKHMSEYLVKAPQHLSENSLLVQHRKFKNESMEMVIQNVFFNIVSVKCINVIEI